MHLPDHKVTVYNTINVGYDHYMKNDLKVHNMSTVYMIMINTNLLLVLCINLSFPALTNTPWFCLASK